MLAKSRGVTYRTVPYAIGTTICQRWPRINEHTKIMYLANPNNPTGTIFTRQEFDAFYKHVPERVLIILDEAYFEYAKDNPRYPDSMHYRYDNVITLAHVFQGLRICGSSASATDSRTRIDSERLKVKLPSSPARWRRRLRSQRSRTRSSSSVAGTECAGPASPDDGLQGMGFDSSHRTRTSS